MNGLNKIKCNIDHINERSLMRDAKSIDTNKLQSHSILNVRTKYTPRSHTNKLITYLLGSQLHIHMCRLVHTVFGFLLVEDMLNPRICTSF